MNTKNPIYILGISCNIHQSAASLTADGVLIAAVEEERFTRKKYDSRFPISAIEYCLKETGIKLSDVQYAGFYWQPWKGLLKRIWWLIRYFPRSLSTFKNDKEWRGSVFTLFQHLAVPFKLRKLGFNGKFYYIEHHIAHASSAFFVSPYEKAAILTVDACGESCTTLLGIGNGNKMRVIKRTYLPHSLGLYYGALTQYLGYKMLADEYRVMGLASYGEPKYYDVFSKMIKFKEGKLLNDNSWFSFHLGGNFAYSDKWIKEFGPACADENSVQTGEYKHYASSGQKVLEDIFFDMAFWLQKNTGEKNLVMAGGVALNSSANGKLLQKKIFDNIWIQPSAYDPGCTIGVCFYIWHHILDKPRTFQMEHAYWGPEYSERAVLEAIKKFELDYEIREDIEQEAARLISEGNVVGWYQGRMEWGPRSLGNRSILADPRRREMKDIVNRKIKFREPYRPFAPSVLEEDVEQYFDYGISPYMLFVCPVRADKQKIIPAVTHVDGTARIQTVSKKTNPRYWNLINEFKKLTGVSLLLNTSFNVKGEQIVCTPNDAIKCFLNTEMDYIVLGQYLCKRKK